MDLNRISTTLCTVKKHTETQFLFLFEIGILTTFINKTKHPKTREKKVQDGKTHDFANKETSQEVGLQGNKNKSSA
jgi:hypothetical protein